MRTQAQVKEVVVALSCQRAGDFGPAVPPRRATREDTSPRPRGAVVPSVDTPTTGDLTRNVLS